MRWLYILRRTFGDLAAHSGRCFFIVAALSMAAATFCFAVSIQRSVRDAIEFKNEGLKGFRVYGYPKRHPFTLKDLHALEHAFAGRMQIAGEALCLAILDGGPKKCIVYSSVHYHGIAYDEVMLSGRWLSAEDDRDGNLVGVANMALVKYYGLNAETALGKIVNLNGVPLTIIGVRDENERTRKMFGEVRLRILDIPYPVLRRRFLRTDELDGMGASVLKKGQNVDALADEAVGILRKTRKLKQGEPNNFLVYSSEDVRRDFLKVSRPFRIASALTALVSALLAVSVGWYLFTLLAQQRRREMGIQRALGASRPQVFLGHVFEAYTLLSTSVFLGVLMSWAATNIVWTHFAGHNTNYAVDWKLFIGTSLQDVLITCSLWAVLGACMALLPVRKVLKLSPCELLK